MRGIVKLVQADVRTKSHCDEGEMVQKKPRRGRLEEQQLKRALIRQG